MEKAIDEVIADACEMMLQDGSAVTELATKNKSLWENIKAFINTIVEKLKNAFKGVSESSAAAVELKNILVSGQSFRRCGMRRWWSQNGLTR